MKKIKFAALLLCAGAGYFTQSAQAQQTFSNGYNAGDLLIGFRDSAASTVDYLIDVGPVSTFLNASSPFVISGLGSTGSNLSAVFSSDSAGWYSSGLASWGVAGDVTKGNGAVVLYAGSPTAPGSISSNSTYAPNASGTQNQTAGYINEVGNDYASGAYSSYSGNIPAIQESTGDTNSWAAVVAAGGGSFNQFSGFEGVTPAALNLYQIFPTSKSNGLGTPGTTYEGQFTIASNGAITYTPVGAVPEPSALTALAGGAGLLGLIRRRRAVVA